MACERFRDALADAAAGAPIPAGVEAHLASCEACRAERHALRQALAVADVEMGRLLATEPSPELAARIRRAVAEKEPSPGWRLGWLWPATAAAMAALVGLAAWTGRSPVAPSPSAAVIPRDAVVSGPEGSSAPEGPRSPDLAARPPRATPAGVADAAAHGRARGHALPEVLVPSGESETLLRLVALVHRDRLSLAGLGAGRSSSRDRASPSPLEVIPPLEIVPLDQAESPGT